MSNEFETDILILGGGTAGCVLAGRLSEDPSCRVTLVEDGPRPNDPRIAIPAGMAQLIGNKTWDWAYESPPDPSIGNRRFIWSAGRTLGGSSAINGQVYIRGLRRDYQAWDASGADGWDYDALLPYFKKSERNDRYNGGVHGTDGPQWVSSIRSQHPLAQTFLKACEAQGLTLADLNESPEDSVGLTQATQRNGRRHSAYDAYVKPHRNRPNLRILTRTKAERILLNEGSATGAELTHRGERLIVTARRKVVVSCGAIGSPALLMRSGIGPGGPLQSRGISVAAALPGVGRNLQEHAGIAIAKTVNVPTYNSERSLWGMARQGWAYLVHRSGALATPAVQAMAFARTSQDLAGPDVQLHFLPLAYMMEPDTLSAASADMPADPAIMITASICQPKTRGMVKLGAEGAVTVQHELIGTDEDVQTLVRGCALIERLFQTDPLRAHVTGALSPDPIPSDAEGWEAHIRAKANVCYHPVGTCAMGETDDAVTNTRLHVRTLQRLMVVDASVMPTITSGNTNATVLAIGEKAADIIRADNR